ncbi:MAG: STAS domain-containing protein [Candidatus Riflebacteria bacterium]|nr:STAS domain-containing protein [Candidatus Riflebacteria bacterium]
MSDFSFQRHNTAPGISCVSLSGKVKSDNIDQFDTLFQELLKNENKKIVLDFSQTEFINSKAIGIILKTLGSLRKCGGDMVVVNVSPQILQVFQLLTLDKIMKFFPTMSDAISGFQKPVIPPATL